MEPQWISRSFATSPKSPDQAAGAVFDGEDSSFVTGQTLLVDGGWMFG
jgi:NAD(P)-dependent dehydrogenase (short-subunit alcohol dehydrogenase family)